MFKLTLIPLIFFSSVALAQNQEVIVLPEIQIQQSEPQNRASDNKTVVSKEQIEVRQVKTVADALRSVEGLQVINSGGFGQTTSVFLRGSNSDHVLVLIDGIEINDLLSPTRAATLEQMSIHEIESIEVLRGAQTLRFGASALSGVINIITKKGSGAPKRIVSAEVGKFSSIDGMLALSGGEPDSNYDLRYSQFQTDGFSVADEGLQNEEADGYSRSQVSGRFGATPIKNLDLDLSVRYIDSFAENDLGGGSAQDDFDYYSDKRQLYASLKSISQSKSKFLTLENLVALQRFDRVDHNSPDLKNSQNLHEDYHAQFLKASSVAALNWNASHTTQLGFDFKEDRGRSNQFTNRSLKYLGAFASHSYQQSRGIFFDSGVRWDQQLPQNDDAFSECSNCYYTTQNGIGYSLSANSKVRLGAGTSIKQPSLYQLYSSFGNTSLKTERGTTADVSYEHEFLDGWGRFYSSVFYNHFENLIEFQSSRYFNQGEAETYGGEVSVRGPVSPGIFVGTSYTLLRTRSFSSGLPLLRRPKEAATADLQFNLTANLQLLHSTHFVGVRDDVDALTAQRKSLPRHFVSRLVTNYQLSSNSSIHVRIENLYNHKYQEVDGFGTTGRAGYLGFTSQF